MVAASICPHNLSTFSIYVADSAFENAFIVKFSFPLQELEIASTSIS